MTVPTPSVEEPTRFSRATYEDADCDIIPFGEPVVLASAFDKERAARLEAEKDRDTAIRFIQSQGFRRCDIAACNCGSWHGGNAYMRLCEIREHLEESSDLNGKTILGAVKEVSAQLAAAAEREAKLVEFVRDVRMKFWGKLELESALAAILSPTVQQADSGKPDLG